MIIILLIVLIFILYFRILNYGYVVDDLTVFIEKKVPKPKEWWKILWLELKGDAYFNSKSAHALSLIIHTITCVLIYFTFGRNNISFLAAVLFAINPVNTQVSIWLSGKPYGVSAIFVLLMFWFPFLSPLFAWLTSYWSVNCILSPLMFLFTKFWYLSFLSIIIFCFKYKEIFRGEKIVSSTNKALISISPRKLIIFLKTYGYYFQQCLWPTRLGFYHKFLYTFGVDKEENRKGYQLTYYFWIGLICVLMPLISTIWLGIGQYGVSWGLWWFSVNIVIFCNFITMNQGIGLRYCYLANIGLSLALANILINYPLLAVVFIVYYTTRLWLMAPMYKADFWLTEYQIFEEPEFHYVWLLRGNNRFGNEQFKEALSNYFEALRWRKNDFKTNFNIASCYIALGKTRQAREYLIIAERCEHGDQEESKADFINRAKEIIVKIELSKARGEMKISLPINEIPLTV